MDAIVSNLVLAARRIARAPVFAAATVATLALGIGANTAIFSVVNGVLLEPLPFDGAEDLVGVWHTAPGLDFDEVNMSPASYFTYREQGRAFDQIGVWDNISVSITGVDEPERVPAMVVSHDLLELLRVQPILGRRFTAEDDTPDAPNTVMLSHGYWQRRFGEDGSVLGRAFSANGTPVEVIGVLPEGFRLPRVDADVFFPTAFDRSRVFLGNFDYQGIARLAEGVTLEQANADVERMIPLSAENFPGGISVSMLEQARFGPRVRPLKRDYVGDVGSVLWVLFGTVGMVLLIACANVANLFLVRSEGRVREVAVRSALGAGRRVVARHFLIESILLGLTGGAVGVALAYGGLRLLVGLGPANIPRLAEIGLQPPVLAFALGISLFAGVFFGLFPVLRFRTMDLVSALREGGRGAGAGRERHRARNVLMTAQVALALVLLVGSGLMLRSLWALRDVRPGFERPEEVLTFQLTIPTGEIQDNREALTAYRQMIERVSGMPGVRSAALTFSATMDGRDSNDAVWVEDFPTPEGQLPPIRRMKWISPGYFGTMENPLLAGRDFEWADLEDTRPTVIVTENLAREYWSGPAEAVGKRLGLGTPELGLRWFEIVGVVGDVHDNGLSRDAVPVTYWPMLQENYFDANQETALRRSQVFVIRARPGQDPTALVPGARDAVWSINSSLPLARIRTLADIVAASLERTSFTLLMLGIAAGVSLLLATVGIYGVVSYVVSQRTREIGVRMALGARRGDVSTMVVRQGMLVAGVGVLVGMAGALGLTRLMSALLFGVTASDPLTYVLVGVLLTVVALAASYVPAARAARVDPVEALRWE